MKEIVKGIFVETEYDGANVGAIQLEDEIYYVDSPSYPRDARQWMTALGLIHSRPARFLFLTDCGGDRLLNVRWLHAPLVVHQHAYQRISEFKRRYPQEWLHSLSVRNPAAGKELSSGPIEPVSLSFTEELKILGDGMSIVLKHEPGPTPESSWLYIPERRILFTGDSIVVGTHPPIAEMNSKSWIESLERLTEFDDIIDVVIPGRGPVSDSKAALPIVEYLKEIRRIVQDHIDAGKTGESLSDYVDDLANCFPLGTLPLEWIKGQILRGLERVYQEIIVEEYLESNVFEQL